MRSGLWSLLNVLAICLPLASTAGGAADDGRRAVEAKRYGIVVRVPQAWRLVSWGRDNQAFRLRVPQDSSSAQGFVQCELEAAPADLAECQKSDQTLPPSEPMVPGSTRRLLENRVERIDPHRFGPALAQWGQLQASVWEMTSAAGERTFEVRSRLVAHGTLYSFLLRTDEAHFEAYRLDFQDMLASARFTPPETGIERLPGGMWMQRDFRFALSLPAGWKPGFGPRDNVLFFATGEHHGRVTDQLSVRATPPRPLDLARLKDILPAEIAEAEPGTEAKCRIVPQGGTFALEIRTSSARDGVKTLERRFRSNTRNYEVRFRCEAGAFEKLEPELLRSLDSFREVLEAPRGEA